MIIETAQGNPARQSQEDAMAQTFKIFVRTADGEEFMAFTWRGNEADGVARAKREGAEFGYEISHAWGEPS